jgi:hypothetical protein
LHGLSHLRAVRLHFAAAYPIPNCIGAALHASPPLPVQLRLTLCVIMCISIAARDNRHRFISDSAGCHFQNSPGRNNWSIAHQRIPLTLAWLRAALIVLPNGALLWQLLTDG